MSTSRVDPARAWIIVGIVAVLIGVGAIGYLGYRSATQEVALDQQQEVIDKEVEARVSADQQREAVANRLDEAIKNIQALSAQVRANGDTPVVGEPPPVVSTTTGLSESEARSMMLQIVRQYSVSSQGVHAIVDAALARLPDPEKGETGDGVSSQEVFEAVQPIAISYLAANPAQNGADGDDGKDGNGIKSIDYDDATCMIVTTFDDGTVTELGPTCGQDGKDGKDALPMTIRFRFPGPGKTEYLVTCQIVDNAAPTDCDTQEAQQEDPQPTPEPTPDPSTTTSPTLARSSRP